MPKDIPFPHALTIEEIIKQTFSSYEGLSAQEVERRRGIYGSNELKEKKMSPLLLFFHQFQNILIYILLLAALISMFAGRWIDFGVIIFIVILNGTLSFWQELKAEISISALKKMVQKKQGVVRQNQFISIPSQDLVFGDYVWLSEGDVVCADIRLFDTHNLMIDESTLTGESLPVEKDALFLGEEKTPIFDQKNMVFSGTHVARGSGKGFVVATGNATQFAKIAGALEEKHVESPLTRALRFFAKRYTYFLISFLFFVGLYGHFQGRSFFSLAYIMIAELVSAVPEGLPLVITLVMVFGAIALSKKKTLVRYLPAVEVLGSATVIATDKTGTITYGSVSVAEKFFFDEEQLIMISALCNDAKEGRGDPIDVALSLDIGDFESIRQRYPRLWSYPFDTKTRFMATAHEIKGEKLLLIKGAFESVLPMATNSSEEIEELERVLHRMTENGLRVLAFGEGVFQAINYKEWKVRIVGLIGFWDPPKEGIEEAIRIAKQANIHVFMITGDHPKTAVSIAKKIGLWEEGTKCLSGYEIEHLDDDVLYHRLKSSVVAARILPEHKHRIVKVLQERKEIVAVSGDGVNDIPALRAADLGIAMGGGAEAARDVAKMVIEDNNLKVIVDAIRYGRVIADNIRKVLYYLISSALQEIVLISLSILAGLPLPLTPIQILWINLVTDGVQDKTFPFIKEETGIMTRHPRDPLKQFFDRKQIVRCLVFGFGVGTAIFLLFRTLLAYYSYPFVISIIFTCTASAQWFNGIQAQKEEEPFFKNIRRSFTLNPYIFIAIGGGLVLQLFAIYGIPSIFSCVYIPLKGWIFPMIICLLSFAIVEIRKWVEWIWKKAAISFKIRK